MPKVEAKIHEEQVEVSVMWYANSYSKSGFFKSASVVGVVYVDKALGTVTAMNDLSFEDGQKQESFKDGTFSEEFVLKVIALSSNKEKYSDLK